MTIKQMTAGLFASVVIGTSASAANFTYPTGEQLMVPAHITAQADQITKVQSYTFFHFVAENCYNIANDGTFGSLAAFLKCMANSFDLNPG